MTKQEFQDLLDRYFSGIVSDSERQLIENFYTKLQETEDGWNAFSQEKKDKLRAEIYEAIQKKKREKEAKPARNWIWRVAASVAIILGVTLTYYLSQSELEINYLTKSTSRGQKATITLSDGSTVRLNSESSITYPETFASLESRDIQLTGEAFFDVKRNTEKPFSIKSGDLLTTVLGTSFNISAFPEDNEIEVTVASGKVSVSPFGGGQGEEKVQILTPGQQATFNKKSNELAMNPVNIDQFTAWKDGIIYLSDAGYKQVFEQLTLWYGVEFQFANEPAEKWVVSGEFKDMSLELVLNTIGYSKGFEFQIRRNDVVSIKFEN